MLVLGGLMVLGAAGCKNDMVEVIYVGGSSNAIGAFAPVRDTLVGRNPFIVTATPEQNPGIAPAN